MTSHRRPHDTAGAALAPGYITTVRPEVPEAWRRPYRPTTVILVAWGADSALAGAALHRGQAAAREHHHPVRDTIASHTPRMSDGILCDEAQDAAQLYEMGDGAAWWLLPHSAVSPDDLARAKAAVLRLPDNAVISQRPYPFDVAPESLDGCHAPIRRG